jgi:hypothetical protein
MPLARFITIGEVIRLFPLASRLAPRASHTRRPRRDVAVQRLYMQPSCLMPLASRLARPSPRASLAPRLTPRASRLAPLASLAPRLIPYPCGGRK